MSKLSMISSIVALTIGTGAYYTNPDAKKLIDKHIIGVQEVKKAAPPTPEIISYILADGTGSTNQTYNIPRVTPEFVNQIADETYNTGGKLYLSHIDNDSRNNKLLYLDIEKKIVISDKPERESQETSFEYTKRLSKWEENNVKLAKDLKDQVKAFQKKKSRFLKDVKKLLSKKVYVKSKENKWTDVIGSLNSAFATLSQDGNENVKKYVIGFSDMEQDLPKKAPKVELAEKDEDITVISVNPIQNVSKKVSDEIIEMAHPDKVLETIFKKGV